MRTKLKPNDSPMTGAQAVAAMTHSEQPSEATRLERELLTLRADMARVLDGIDRLITQERGRLARKPEDIEGNTPRQKR